MEKYSFNYNFHNVLKIKSNIDLGMPYFEVSDIEPDLLVKVVDDCNIHISDKNIKLGTTYFGEYDKNYIYYKTSLLKQKLELYLEDVRGKTRIFCNKAYQRYVRLPLVYSTPIEVIVWRTGWVKLLYKGYTFLHSACLTTGKDAFLLIGFSNTGKSVTCLRSLLQNKNFQYLSDDVTILDAEGKAYCNFTRISSRVLKAVGLPITLKNQITIALENMIPPPLSYFINQRKTISLDIENIIGISRISEKAKVRAIIFIERGPDGVSEFSKDMAIERILIQNVEGLNPLYSSIPILLYYSYLNLDFNINNLKEIEQKIITKVVENCDVFIVRSHNGNFVGQVQKIIHDYG